MLKTKCQPHSEGALLKAATGEAWLQLHPDIQQRFEKNPPADHYLYYQGELSQLWCSRLGQCMAWLSWPMIKGALLPWRAQHVPVKIQVFSDPAQDAIYKQRLYYLQANKPVSFTSKMRATSNQVLLEYVGAGLGMELHLQVHNGELHFHSQRYFWELFGKRWPLPHNLTPGKTWLVHRNIDQQRFAIYIEMKHPWWGITFIQEGIFIEVSAPLNDH